MKPTRSGVGKPTYGSGKHLTIFEPDSLHIAIGNTLLGNKDSFKLVCSYYWEDAISPTEFSPPVDEEFLLTELKNLCSMSFCNGTDLILEVDTDVDMMGFLSCATVRNIEDKVLREIREEAQYV